LGLAAVCGARALQLTVAELGLSAAAQRVAVYAYLLNPYLLGDALLRNANAEYTALCCMPIALLGVVRASALLTAAGFSLVLCAHPLGALLLGLTCPWLCGASRLRWRQLARGVGVALPLTAWAWLPVLAYRSSVQSSELLRGKFDFHQNFISLTDLFSSRSFYASGPLPLLAAVCAVLLAVRRRERAGLALVWGLTVLALLQLPVSSAVWESVPVAKYLQFPWRLMGPYALLAALLSAYAFEGVFRRTTTNYRWPEWFVLLLCCGVALPQFARMRIAPAAVVEARLGLADLAGHPQSATVGDEYLPRGASRALANTPARERAVLRLGAEVAARSVIDEPRWLVVEVDASHDTPVCLARYGGEELWELRVDGREAAVSAARGAGCLSVQVPSGRHRVEAVLSTPRWRVVGLLVSALALGVIVLVRRRSMPGR
jgi:hypothetical protein